MMSIFRLLRSLPPSGELSLRHTASLEQMLPLYGYPTIRKVKVWEENVKNILKSKKQIINIRYILKISIIETQIIS